MIAPAPFTGNGLNPEKSTGPGRAGLWLLPVVLLVFVSCSHHHSSPSNGSANATGYTGPGNFAGQVVVDSITRTDTVVSVDTALRRIELKHADGKITSYQCGTQVTNFDQIKAGDRVKATVVEETALFLKPASAMQSIETTNSTVPGRLRGKPGTVSLNTLDFTAKVLSINPWLHQATLQMADGRTKTITVGEFVNLADFNVGDVVAVRVTQALAVLVEKP